MGGYELCGNVGKKEREGLIGGGMTADE